jgi:hypothetical protein
MRWSTVLKFFLGVLLAIAILAGGGLVAARVMIARLSVPPSKPMFPNDTPTAKPAAAKPAATEKPSAEKAETPAKPLPTGAFPAKVTQSIGLVIRDAPSLDSVSVGGVDFNERVTVIETSPDGSWQKIRLGNDTEGWVRAGNVEKVSN